MMLFQSFEQAFNERESYTDDVLSIYETKLGKNGGLRNRFPFMVSHLSNDDGVVEFRTLLDSTYQQVVHIYFVDTLTNGENIFKALKADSLTINYSDGTVRKTPNVFHFNEMGQVIKK